MIFGGEDPGLAALFPPAGTPNEAWTLDLGCSNPAPTAWFSGGPGASWPSPRRQHTLTWHPTQRRFVVFGGEDGTPSLLGDVWALRLP
jgi:hypothetical protein